MTTIESFQFRPIMSRLRFATILPTGTGEFLTNHLLPHRPCSSPLTVRKIIDRRGGACANASASASTPAVPDASSSAPFQMLSFTYAPLVPTWSMWADTTMNSSRNTGSVPIRMPTELGADDGSNPAIDVDGFPLASTTCATG